MKRHLHGQAKEYVRELLKFIKPSVLHTQLYVDGLPGMVKHEIPSKDVLKKISSSEKACGDLDKEDLIDLTGRMTRDMELNKHDGKQVFLKVPAIPMECVKQVLIVNAADKYDIDPVIHFDATESIIKNMLPNSKRIFLYSGVMHWRTGKEAFPLFDFLSNDQSQIFIASLLQLVQGFIVHH